MPFNHKKLTPIEYEQEVQAILNASSISLENFEVEHSKKIQGKDGEFEIDVVATFEFMGADFVVLVECKYYTSPVKREVIQVLNDKLRSTGSHKGMVFSTSGFQRGAIEYAKANGIALVHFKDGSSFYLTRSMNKPSSLPDWVPAWVGWIISESEEGNLTYSVITKDESMYLDAFLKVRP